MKIAIYDDEEMIFADCISIFLVHLNLKNAFSTDIQAEILCWNFFSKLICHLYL